MGEFLHEATIPSDGTLAPLPLERDPITIYCQGVADALYDIDILPLTYTNSRWYAFFYRADEKDLKNVLPEPLKLEDDIVEFWYVTHTSTMIGPYLEAGVTVSASYDKYKGGYYPWMWLTEPAGVGAGREPFGFPKKAAYISCLEHGGKKDNGLEEPGREFFSFFLERRGYLINQSTGHYSSDKMSDLPALPIFYGKTDWGRFNYRMITYPDLSKTEMTLTYLDSQWEGKHRFQLRPGSVSIATAKDIRTWYLGATPYDNVGALLPVKELIGLLTFSFDLIIPPATPVWSKTVKRAPEEIAKYCTMGESYRYSMRHRFPKPYGC